MVVLKELIFNNFYLGMSVVVLKELNFNDLLLWEGVVVLKVLNSRVSTLVGYGGLDITTILRFATLGGCCGLESTELGSFYCG